MTPSHERFARWVDWLGVSKAEVARRLGCSAAMVSFLCSGERTASGFKLVSAIEREMARPRNDGEVFPEPPIAGHEWTPQDATGTTG